MQKEDLTLILTKDDKVIHTSSRSGLRPLAECMSKHDSTGCVLFDKVHGLAAARITVRFGAVSKVIARVCSRPGKRFLTEKGVELEAETVVDNILMRDRSAICPMEQKALELHDDEEYFAFVDGVFNR